MTVEKKDNEIKKILFRASRLGIIVSGLAKGGITAIQHEELERLERLKNDVIGLTAEQQKKFETLCEKVAGGETLTAKQDNEMQSFRFKLNNPKGLTDKQSERYKELKDKLDAPPKLTKGAETEIKRLWLENEKGYKEEIVNKTLKKGIEAEEDGIKLVSIVDGIYYTNNNNNIDARVSIGNITGKADIVDERDVTLPDGSIKTLKIVHDIKCNWSPYTFMMGDLTTVYEWQGRAYMYLYDADFFKLRFCLVDCPPDIYEDERSKFCFKHGIIDDTLEEYQEMLEQFDRNLIYTTSGRYTQEERVKTYTLERDYELENIMLTAISLAVDYYKTIELNMF